MPAAEGMEIGLTAVGSAAGGTGLAGFIMKYIYGRDIQALHDKIEALKEESSKITDGLKEEDHRLWTEMKQQWDKVEAKIDRLAERSETADARSKDRIYELKGELTKISSTIQGVAELSVQSDLHTKEEINSLKDGFVELAKTIDKISTNMNDKFGELIKVLTKEPQTNRGVM